MTPHYAGSSSGIFLRSVKTKDSENCKSCNFPSYSVAKLEEAWDADFALDELDLDNDLEVTLDLCVFLILFDTF